MFSIDGHNVPSDVFLPPLDLHAGKYSVFVHLHECKDIQPQSEAAELNVMVEVSIQGDARSSRSHWFVRDADDALTTSALRQPGTCTFGEHFTYNASAETDADARSMGVVLALYDVRGVGGRRLLIGSFTVQLAWLAAQRGRELYRRWFGLERLGAPGVTAKLRVSLAVTWDHGSNAVHGEDEPSDDELILLPTVRKHARIVVVRVHRAIGLPKVGMVSSISPSVEVSHGREAVSTSIVNNQRAPLWEQQLELPIVVPAVKSAVAVTLWDHSELLGREAVGATAISFDDIPSANDETLADGEPPLGVMARWHFLRGAPPLLAGRQARRMNSGREPGLAFRGRVLLTVWARKQSGFAQSFDLPLLGPPQALLPKRSIDALGNLRLVRSTVPRVIEHEEGRRNRLVSPIEDEYALRVWLFSGAYLPVGALTVEVEFGGTLLQSDTHACLNGEIHFLCALKEVRRLPNDPQQLPDIYVFLARALLGRPVRVAYIRYTASQLLQEKNFSWDTPTWQPLSEVPGFTAPGAAAGFLLLSTTLCRAREVLDPAFTRDLRFLWADTARYELTFCVYLCKRFWLRTDDSGSLKSFLLLRCGAQQLKTHSRTQTSLSKW